MLSRVGLICDEGKDETLIYAEEASAYLRSKGIEIFRPDMDGPLTADALISFGGDGTLLRSVQYAVKDDIPLLGLNLGTLGFLTEEKPDDLRVILDVLIRQQYSMDSRRLLAITNGSSGEQFVALNDAVVTRGGYARLISVEVTVDGERIGRFTADGIIVSSPTGSTGYSLSAGGPVVAPAVECMVITPVCAHTMQRSPYIVPVDAEVTIEMLKERRHEAVLQVDGRNKCRLDAGSRITITDARKSVRLIRLKPYHFFSLTLKKLNEWGIGREYEPC